jgi:hypothetical protein
MTQPFVIIEVEVRAEINWIEHQIKMLIIIPQTAKVSHQIHIGNRLVVLIITEIKIVIIKIKKN